jgi:hypothetical protein
MSDELLNTLKRELKKFYFKNFKRRGKSLKTLELIKECYNDQLDFYIHELKTIIKKSLESKDEKLVLKLLSDFKKNEGCNKKIMKFIVNELIVENKLKFIYIPKNHRLFEFEEE